MQAVTGTAGCTPRGPRDAGIQPEVRAQGGAGALPTPLTSPQQGDPTENTLTGPQMRAEGDSGGGPDPRRAELMAAMSLADLNRCDRDLIHYDMDKELGSRRFRMGPPGTTGVCIGRQDTGAGRCKDHQQPTSRAQAGEPAGNANPPPSAAMDEDAHSSAAADAGPHTQAPPAASSEAANTAEEAPCP